METALMLYSIYPVILVELSVVDFLKSFSQIANILLRSEL